VSSVSPPLRNCLDAIDVFVLAGGLGTRIRPVLGDIPKLLAPIGRRTYLDHLLNWLRGFGARRVVLGLGVRAQAIVDYAQAHPIAGIEIETVVEPSPLGTAGAIRFARATLRSDPILVVNGDSFADTDLCRLLERHHAACASATMLCAEVEEAGRYGRLALDGRCGLRFRRRPLACRALASAIPRRPCAIPCTGFAVGPIGPTDRYAARKLSDLCFALGG